MNPTQLAAPPFAESLQPGPVQVRVSRSLRASANEVFAVLADQASMHEWVPMLSHVEASEPCQLGETRVCTFGGDELRETVVEWSPPSRYAYHADDTVDAIDHLGIIECRLGTEPGTVDVTWTQHFTPRAKLKGWLMRRMMGVVLRRALRNLGERIASQREAGQ